MTITNAEIVSRLKLLADEHQKADSGTDTTVKCSALSEGKDLTKQFICFISGDNINVDRVITDFEASTGTCTFGILLNPVLDIDEFCIVSKGFQSDISQAEQVIRNDLRNRGYDLDLFLNYETQLKEMYIYKTIELVCAGLMNDGVDTDVYFVNYERFRELYLTELSSLIADYDANQDGEIDEGEEGLNLGQVFFAR